MKLILPLLLAPALLTAQGRAPDFSKPVWTSPVEFTSLYSLRELADGRIIAPDFMERAIHLLNAEGRPVGTIGRRGGGPQEFERPLSVFALPGDSTLVNDPDQKRFLLIGPDARPIRTIAWPELPNGEDGMLTKVDADALGNLYFPHEAFGLDEQVTALLRWRVGTPRFDSVQTLAQPRVAQAKAKIEGTETLITKVVPFDAGDIWDVAPSGEVAVLHPREYRLEWRAKDGTVTRGAPIPYRPVPVSPEERAGRPGSVPMELPIPATKPAAISIVVSPRGEIWVARYLARDSKDTQWDILGPDGKILRSVTLPGNRWVIGFGRENVFVRYTDEDDLQHLEAYR